LAHQYHHPVQKNNIEINIRVIFAKLFDWEDVSVPYVHCISRGEVEINPTSKSPKAKTTANFAQQATFNQKRTFILFQLISVSVISVHIFSSLLNNKRISKNRKRKVNYYSNYMD